MARSATAMKMAHLLRWRLRPFLRRMRHTPRSGAQAPPRIWTILIAVRACGARVSYALDDPFAEQSLRTEQEKREREYVGEPVFNCAAHQGAPIDFGDFFADADDEAAGDGAGDGREATQDEDGQRL